MKFSEFHLDYLKFSADPWQVKYKDYSFIGYFRQFCGENPLFATISPDLMMWAWGYVTFVRVRQLYPPRFPLQTTREWERLYMIRYETSPDLYRQQVLYSHLWMCLNSSDHIKLQHKPLCICSVLSLNLGRLSYCMYSYCRWLSSQDIFHNLLCLWR